MGNLINYIYIITSYGFIFNTLTLLLIIGGCYNTITNQFPTKIYFVLPGLLILALIVLRVIFIYFLDTDSIISNQCAAYYQDHINLRFALILVTPNALFLLIRYMYNDFSISNMFDNIGTIICSVVLIFSIVIAYKSFHLSVPDTCKANQQIELLNDFWSQ